MAATRVTGLLRHSQLDLLLIGVTFAHAAVVWMWPNIFTIGLAMWWNLNTVAHNFIHLPFFRSSRLNAAFSLWLSLLNGVPQTLWRARHLAHHRGHVEYLCVRTNIRPLILEVIGIATVWGLLATLAPQFFFLTYVPGMALGLFLSHLQGRFEHVRGTVSYYGRFYNWLFFNDGLHVEHHSRPGLHWTRLRAPTRCTLSVSRWPAVLRWVELVDFRRFGALGCSLFIVCLAAKFFVMAKYGQSPAPLSLFAMFAQDALLCACLLLFEAWRRTPAVGLYALLVIYISLNAVVTLILGSPLTVRMWGAAGPALTDSISHYLTTANLALIGSLLVLAVFLPLTWRRFARNARLTITAIVVALALSNSFVSAPPEPWQRNAVFALAESFAPRIPARPGEMREGLIQNRGSQGLMHLQGAAKGRNIVLIALESTGAAYFAPDIMPNLSALAQNAIVFQNAYAAYPESIKGLFSLLASRFPAADTSVEMHADAMHSSLPRRLTGLGYTNALFHSGRFMYLGMDSIVARSGFHLARDAGHISGNYESSFGVDEPATVEAMLSWLDSLPRGQRFFLNYLPIAGHHPYDIPEQGPFAARDDRDRYRNAVWWGDKSLGRLFDGLRTRGLYSNTLFVVYGDHGEAFGEHPGNYGHTLQIYEENVKVPLLFAMPGLTTNSVIERAVSLVDIAPTVFDLLGSPVELDGASMLFPNHRIVPFFTDYSQPLLGLRDGAWKVIHDADTGRSLLFHLDSDPAERSNLAAAHPEKVRAYRNLLLDWASHQRWRLQQAS